MNISKYIAVSQSGFSASIGWDVAMAAMPNSCSGSSATELVDAAFLDPPYNVRIGGMQCRLEVIASSRWLQAK
jgi:16S rRNA G966 N2-methylase RsmD